MAHFDGYEYIAYYPGSVQRLVRLLKMQGIRSRQDLLERFDVDATAREYTAIKGVGLKLARLLKWLRGLSIDDWRRLTGTPAFNDPNIEHHHKSGPAM